MEMSAVYAPVSSAAKDFLGGERCVTSQKTAAEETIYEPQYNKNQIKNLKSDLHTSGIHYDAKH